MSANSAITQPPMTPTQFAARALGLLPCPPPEPKRGPRYGVSPVCWLCGGPTDGEGWPQATAIAPTFTQHNAAKAGDSDAVCQSCAALTRAATFQAMVTTRGLPLKVWTQCGWHSYSHHIREDGHYEAPAPDAARSILIDPPAGRWMLCLNTTGKKHTIFRGAVSQSRGAYPVQVDETTVWCRRDRLPSPVPLWRSFAPVRSRVMLFCWSGIAPSAAYWDTCSSWSRR